MQIEQAFVIGLNHHRSNALERGKFALGADRQTDFYRRAASAGFSSFCILNTCNRTEIYGMGNPTLASQMYMQEIGLPDAYSPALFTLQGYEAVNHMFRVASGLDSQVIGDLEILGQFKQAFHSAKSNKMLNGFFERLANTCIQSAKEIRTFTRISSGTVSQAYAAVKYISRNVPSDRNRILLIGTGEFGRSIARNIKDYLPDAELMLANRSQGKAQQLAAELKAGVWNYNALTEGLRWADIVISSANPGQGFLISKAMIDPENHPLVFLDMAIPISIDPGLASPGIKLANIDVVSNEVSATLETRANEIPHAEAILHRHIVEFNDWAALFSRSTTIREWHHIMQNLGNTCPHMSQLPEPERKRIINRSMADFTAYLRKQHDLPADSGSVISHFMTEREKKTVCMQPDNCQQQASIGKCRVCRND